MNFKAIAKNTNTVGTVFALVEYENGTYGVYKLCSNYDGNVRGGITKIWRYVEKDLSEETARNLYNRRLKGKQK